MASKPDADAQWAQRRALFEGAAVTPARLAMACGIAPGTLDRRIREESWRAVSDAHGPASIAGRIRAARVKLLEAVERRQRRAEEEGGGLDAASISDLTAIARMLEKLGEDTRGEAGAKENQAQHDDQIAAVVERLDDKIVELAGHLAEEMAGAKLSAGGTG